MSTKSILFETSYGYLKFIIKPEIESSKARLPENPHLKDTLTSPRLVRRKPGVLRPSFVGMRDQWSNDYGMQDNEYTARVWSSRLKHFTSHKPDCKKQKSYPEMASVIFFQVSTLGRLVGFLCMVHY